MLEWDAGTNSMGLHRRLCVDGWELDSDGRAWFISVCYVAFVRIGLVF